MVVPLDKDVFLQSPKLSTSVDFLGLCFIPSPLGCGPFGERLCPLNSTKYDNAFVLVWKR